MFAGYAWSAELGFSKGPKVSKNGGKTQVTFTVSAATDVEVAILRADGKIVRHLAAGWIGSTNVPPVPLQQSLSQVVEWNGKDDMGKVAQGAPFKVRVRAGMSVKFGRLIGHSPYTGNVTAMPYRGPVNGLTVDTEGNLYVRLMSDIRSHGNSGLWPWHVRKFDKEGNYVKTILPYPPSIDPAKASGLTLLTVPDGAFTPANKNSLYPVLYNFGNEVMRRTIDEQLVFVHTEKRMIRLFKLDGSNALRNVPMWPPKSKVKCARWLDIQAAFSPDGRYLYLSNLAGVPYDGKKPSDIDAKWPQGRIYRKDLQAEGQAPTVFFDLKMPDWEKKKYWMPSAWDKKSAAAGIDVDAKGNVLVCDLVNQALVEISPEGKLHSVTKVPWPDRVVVSKKTGVAYVISRKVSRGHLAPPRLYRISGRGETAVVSAPFKLKGVGPGLALDDSGDTPVLWLAGGGRLVRLEDKAGQFTGGEKNYLNRDPADIYFVGYMDVDRENELVYTTKSGGTVWRHNGDTGEGERLKLKAVDLAIGPGGHIYTWGISGRYSGPIGRFTRDQEPAPLPGLGKHTYGNLYGRAGRGSSVCGMDVDKYGRVFATFGSNLCHVRVYDEKGQLLDFPQKLETKDKKGKISSMPVAIDYVSGYGGSLRVDLDGNIYLLQSSLPKGFKKPVGYEKDTAYRVATGTILKFGPKGGKRKVPVNSGGRGGNPLEYSGLLNMYPDCGPISSWNCAGSCACTKPRFDVDDYGRLYIPNAMTFKVSVRDNAGKEIVKFGHYGNLDCQGPESKEPKPEIPLGWPVTVGASDKYIYVGDCLNHRIVRVDKKWATEKTVGF